MGLVFNVSFRLSKNHGVFPIVAPIGRRKTAPKERRKLAGYEVAGTIGKIILS
jgi:hypothetical protein